MGASQCCSLREVVPCFFVAVSSSDSSVFSHSCTALQVTLGNCSAESDTHCGCQSGWCIDCFTEPCGKSSPFSCVQCRDYETTTPRESSAGLSASEAFSFSSFLCCPDTNCLLVCRALPAWLLYAWQWLHVLSHVTYWLVLDQREGRLGAGWRLGAWALQV